MDQQDGIQCHTKFKWALFPRILISIEGKQSWGIHTGLINDVRESDHWPFARLELADVETHPLVNYVSATLREVMELVKTCFVSIIIHSCPKNGLICGQKERIFPLFGWRADDMVMAKTRSCSLSQIENSVDWISRCWTLSNVECLSYLPSMCQCRSHAFRSKAMSQA